MADGQLRECLIPSLSEPPQSLDVVIEAARLLREPQPGLMLVGPCRVGGELVGSQPLGARGHLVEERRTIGVDAHAVGPGYTRGGLREFLQTAALEAGVSLRAGTLSPTCRRSALTSGQAAQFEPV